MMYRRGSSCSEPAAKRLLFMETPEQGCLHAGVATENILDGYINTIKVLQKIDGNGILMTAVTWPIKAYLRARPDTIRCVVKMLTQVPPALHAVSVPQLAVPSPSLPSSDSWSLVATSVHRWIMMHPLCLDVTHGVNF
jgi:hypothetical protein